MDKMNDFIQIAIDGPAAAGKSTIAKLMAKRLNFVYIDTGAMYRAITWAVLQAGLDVRDEPAVGKMLAQVNIDLKPDGRVFVNQQDVTDAIRENLVTRNVSLIASYSSVRDDLKHRQVLLSNVANVIMDGRDIGTNVLPNAKFKFFMIADSLVRAKRRYSENLQRGIHTSISELEQEIIKRDKMDESRTHAPLKQAEDAILIDTSQLTIHEVVDKMISIVLK